MFDLQPSNFHNGCCCSHIAFLIPAYAFCAVRSAPSNFLTACCLQPSGLLPRCFHPPSFTHSVQSHLFCNGFRIPLRILHSAFKEPFARYRVTFAFCGVSCISPFALCAPPCPLCCLPNFDCSLESAFYIWPRAFCVLISPSDLCPLLYVFCLLLPCACCVLLGCFSVWHGVL